MLLFFFWLLPRTGLLLILTNHYFPSASHFIKEIMFSSSPHYSFITFSGTFSNISLSNCSFVVVFCIFITTELFFKIKYWLREEKKWSKCLYLSTLICEAGFSLSGIKWRAAIQPAVAVGTLQNIRTSALRTYLENNHVQYKRSICAWCCRPLVILAQAKTEKKLV